MPHMRDKYNTNGRSQCKNFQTFKAVNVGCHVPKYTLKPDAWRARGKIARGNASPVIHAGRVAVDSDFESADCAD
jgi:hypothetical protein